MADFLPAFEKMIVREGGYLLTDIPGDRGRTTYSGITRRSHPTWAGWLVIDSGGTPDAQSVRDFYKAAYWDQVCGDAIADQRIAMHLFDFSINAGLKTAIKLMQLIVSTTPDGQMGPKTLEAINAVSPELLSAYYTIAKIARYRDIVMKDRSQSKFLLGWLNRSLA